MQPFHPSRSPRPQARIPGQLLLAAALFAFLWAQALPAGAQTGGDTAGLEIRRDVLYREIDGEDLALDVYVPAGAGPFPGVIAIHGGGFVGGDKRLMAPVSQYLARNGYAVFTINYRLAPQFPYPAAVDDARAAVSWVREHAAEYRVDPTKVGIFGASAGGTIAVSAAEGRKDHFSGDGVATAVSWSGALDMVSITQDRARNSRVIGAVMSYIGEPSADPASAAVQQKLAVASPYDHLAKTAPPMFIANALTELMPLTQAQEFTKKLKDLGIPFEFLNPPTGHALKYTQQAEAPTVSFLNKHLRDVVPTRAPSTSPTIPATSPPISLTPTPGKSGGSKNLLLIVVGIGVVVVAGLLAAPAVARRRRHSYW